MPIVRVYRSELVDGIVRHLGHKVPIGEDGQQILLDDRISIGGDYDRLLIIQPLPLNIGPHGIADVRALDLPLSRQSRRMWDELDMSLMIRFLELLEDAGHALQRLDSPLLGGEDDGHILHVRIIASQCRSDAILDDIVRLVHIRKHQDEPEQLRILFDDTGIQEILLIDLQEMDVGAEDVDIGLESLHGPIGDVERDEIQAELPIQEQGRQREDEDEDEEEEWDFGEESLTEEVRLRFFRVHFLISEMCSPLY